MEDKISKTEDLLIVLRLTMEAIEDQKKEYLKDIANKKDIRLSKKGIRAYTDAGSHVHDALEIMRSFARELTEVGE